MKPRANLAFFISAFFVIIVTIAAIKPASAAEEQDSVTTIQITDQVLVENVERLGIHFGGDNYYDSAILKQRVADNFEGGVHRLHVIGPDAQPEAEGIFNFGHNERRPVPVEWIGATAHVLCGPDIWETREIVDVQVKPNPGRNNEESLFYVFNEPVTWPADARFKGVLLDKTDLTQGGHPWMEESGEERDGKRVTVLKINDRHCSIENTRVVTGDTPPEVGQYAAFELVGTSSRAFYQQRVQFHNAAPFGGSWTVKLWAKALNGTEPQMTLAPTVAGTRETFQPEGEWKQYTFKLVLDEVEAGTDANPLFNLEIAVEGGIALIDNLEAWKDSDLENPDNPTPFRDELLNTFRFLNAGSVRYLRNTKNTLENSILPAIENFSRNGEGHRGTDDFGTHEFYAFCMEIQASPWATIPGTVLLEEMDLLMEYHGGPAGTKGGDLRIRLGQEKPWSEVFDQIHFQFGNEVMTFFGTGFYGPDYWSALIERCRQSPYWEEDKYVFHLNEQGCGITGLDEHPAFDRLTTAGYHIFGLYDDQIEAAGDLKGFYDFVYASAWHLWMDERNSRPWGVLNGAKERGKEISIYEGLNYHTTFGSDDPPMEQINKMMAGFAGGVSATHTGLILLKHWGARTMQNFSLSQESFAPGGAFGNLPGRIRGWGGVLRIGNEDERRYRPRFLAQHVANQVIGGDLIETVHSGADPKFSVTNRFGAGYGPSRNPEEMTIENIPRIHSYAFKDGDRRGLILVSMDPGEAQRLRINFEGGVKGGKAKIWWVDADNLEATNEHDWAPEEPQVTIESQEIDFSNGFSTLLPPGTIGAIEWEES